MKLNGKKTQLMLFRKFRDSTDLSTFTISVDRSVVSPTNSARYLGVIFDANYSWRPQVDSIVKKVSRKQGAMHRARSHLHAPARVVLFALLFLFSRMLIILPWFGILVRIQFLLDFCKLTNDASDSLLVSDSASRLVICQLCLLAFIYTRMIYVISSFLVESFRYFRTTCTSDASSRLRRPS